ncbi:MAG: hypothetical protein RL015_2719 [Verrucomicrobiota bacterium]|jgi:hypothetical protein
MNHWPIPQETQAKRWRLGIMLFAFALQWLVSWNQPSPDYYMMTDSSHYWSNATSFREKGRIADTYMPMGSSMCMAACQAIGLKEFDVVLWVHPALNALNCWFAFVIVSHFLRGWWPFLAALWVACYPPQLNYARQLLSEPWFVTSLLALLTVMLRQGFRHSLLTGFLLGWCVLVRSQALGIWAIALLVLFLMGRPKSELAVILSVSVSVIVVGCLIASWSAGKPLFLTHQSLMMTIYRSVPGGWEDIPEAQRHASYLAGLMNHPLDFLTQRFWALVNMLSPWPLDTGRSWKVKFFLTVVDLPILATLVYALVRLLRGFKLPREVWLLVIPLVGLTLFHTLFFAITRYRMPMMLPLIPFAVVIYALTRQLREEVKVTTSC